MLATGGLVRPTLRKPQGVRRHSGATWGLPARGAGAGWPRSRRRGPDAHSVGVDRSADPRDRGHATPGWRHPVHRRPDPRPHGLVLEPGRRRQPGRPDNLRGHLLSPIDLADPATKDLYGKMLIITIPLLTFGGLALGYLIMVSRTSGESAYTARSVTPRFVVGATLAILGIFLVSVLAQFVRRRHGAMVGVSLPGNAVGGHEAWPAAGTRLPVLSSGGFDPHIGEGPTTGTTAPGCRPGCSQRSSATLVQMINLVLSALERLLVIIGPICLAAYALPATERVTNGWLKVLTAILVVRFAWTIAFILFSLEAVAHMGPTGDPPTVGDTKAPARVVDRRAAALMKFLVLAAPGPGLPVAMRGPGVLKPKMNERGLVEVGERGSKQSLAFG